jgi:hypothetical protein
VTEWSLEDERILIGDACRESLWLFGKYAFGVGINPKGVWLDYDVHKRMVRWLEGHLKTWEANRYTPLADRLKVALVKPRAGAKTMWSTKIAQAWIHVRNPDISSYVDSETLPKATKFLSSILRVMEGQDPYALFTWLYGIWYDKDRKWTTTAAIHAMRRTMSISEPSLGAISVESGLTGDHPDALFFDDPISKEKMKEKPTWLETVQKHMVAQIPAVSSNGILIYAGTRYAENDALGVTMDKEKIASLAGMPPDDPTWVEDEDGVWHVWYWEAEDSEGHSTIPSCWSDKWLQAYRRRDLEDYMAQMMNRPATGEHMPLQRHEIEKLWVRPEDVPENLAVWLHMDTAFRFPQRRSRGDLNVIVAMGHAQDGSGLVYFLGARSSRQWGPIEYSDHLIQMVRHFKVGGHWLRGMTDEFEVGGKALTWKNFLKNKFEQRSVQMPSLQLIHRQTQQRNKAGRIIDAASYWSNGYMQLVRHSENVHKLIDQMLKIGKTANDDFAEAAADTFSDDVYTPIYKTDGDQPPAPLRPEDGLLVLNGPAKFSAEEVAEAYAKFDEQMEREVYIYEPVGADDTDPNRDIRVDPWTGNIEYQEW